MFENKKPNIVLTDAQTVLDKLVNADSLKELGNVTEFGLLKYDEVSNAIKDADIIVCNKTICDAKTLSLAKSLKYIGLFATGYNNIDTDYCKEHSITVCNAGSYSTNAVAQHTFALILEYYNNVRYYDKYVHDGLWKRSKTFSPFVYPLNELAGKTIGIVGFGNIGRAVAKIANAFNMNVLAFNRSKKQANDVEFTDLDTLLKKSDIVTVHCPLNHDSENMFNKTTFEKMKSNALFINTARGAVMIEKDLFDALNNNVIGGAAIDTLKVEPMENDCILMKAKNCIMTPHIAWAPVETRIRLMKIVEDNIRNFISGAPSNVIV